jgi:hypothetical protein
MPEDITTTERTEALFAIDPGSPDEVFPGFHDARIRWNGWACPEFDKPVAERIVTWSNTANEEFATEEAITLRWDGDQLFITEYGEEFPLGPNAHGRYPIGAFSWTWSEVEAPDEVDLATYLVQSRACTQAYVDAANGALRDAYDNGADTTQACLAAHTAGDMALRILDADAGQPAAPTTPSPATGG